ncbi:hypothetical protein RB4046 [Rhodopirellula baltica SH 1]|uniref:Uncharacterized protein n=1 Tax=Rhodopirellula baltica (strain DSM 10527 / NCIMB 13988 / SH1) TaxID=243090 RepID=Q7UT78_RHOBA|nr:hypothetical protein RB4046 [Rhodopirellula baltica SH 1]
MQNHWSALMDETRVELHNFDARRNTRRQHPSLAESNVCLVRQSSLDAANCDN